MQRIGLFLATDFTVLTVLSLIMNILGLSQPGLGWAPLLITTSVVGMAGSMISLMGSKRSDPLSFRPEYRHWG